MNTLDEKYINLLQDILDNGVVKSDRTGTGTKSVFSREIRHNMSEGFPLLTTKKMPFKIMVVELLWFLNGDTNIKYLVDNGCNIWNGDAYKRYKIEFGKENASGTSTLGNRLGVENKDTILSEDEFIDIIKNSEEYGAQDFVDKWGDLGPIYGKQWRDWDGIDQIAELINDLKTNPDSRRLKVNAWNVSKLKSMTLPPCHYGFQCYTRELSFEERRDLYKKEIHFSILSHKDLDAISAPSRVLSLKWIQRSVDTFLGLPFNIASYGLLLEILAKEVNMIAGELIGSLGDTHLYLNHIEQAKEQIGGKFSDEYISTFDRYVSTKSDKMAAIKDFDYLEADRLLYIERGLINELNSDDWNLRNPYELPTIEISNNVKRSFLFEGLPSYNKGDFKLVGYKSHPAIKAPLSN